MLGIFFPGCPSVGFYGETCSQRCPVNCQICHTTTGECIRGCTTGFEGARCEKFTRGAFLTFFHCISLKFHFEWTLANTYLYMCFRDG